MSIITINPLTRISGFLEIEVKVENNKAVDAKSSGLLFRGFEKMLQDREPLDAVYFTQRICGICSNAHSMASSLALESALGILPNENDRMIRDFMHGCEYVQNHIRHFYLYTIPDFATGPKLEPVYNNNHTDFRLPKDINDRITDNYINAIKYSRLAHTALAELGGKAPHSHGIFVGGTTVNIDAYKIVKVKSIVKEIKNFVENNMIEDVYTISEYYKDYFNIGKGYGNLLSYGVYDKYLEADLSYVKPGVYINGSFLSFNPDKITESIYNSWFIQDLKSSNKNDVEPDLDKEGAYSFVKAPRYNGYPLEVGPLARMILSNNYDNKVSTMDRTIARVLETKKVLEIMEQLLDRIAFKKASQNQYNIPEEAYGSGLIDTTRGALGHWIYIKNKKINRYNIITPSVWNCSPADNVGVKGVIEQAIIGTEIKDMMHPVEIGRIVRSFDPCISCATHVVSDRFSPVKIII
ncbi:nickel-dependent hydrogenase large subunit [Clostridium sp. SYSU_GA19001]|uniref:nickel-dependent hydrogenase large subunit n=1 Tax=Clostridium caldaquaticum TaxID=2940653 RepID=UPI00207728C9|nr:nickel-dependent hydrogenase large subunit [Clostridium caldaquaticum]MCM8712132.1 nickel-dependent hydrogenase large subunit [Clostridium caldaquaticum]